MTGASRRKRAQAVLFSAIMVLSMVAAGVGGLAGSAAAEVTEISDVTAENATIGDTEQVENITLIGVDKTSSDLGDITVLVENADVSVENAEVVDSGNFDSSNVSADDRASGGLFVTIDGNNTPSGDITLAVTLNTSNAKPGEAVYNATSASGASASGTFQLLSDDDGGDQTDDELLVDPDADGAYDTIQEAVDNAEANDRILIRDGEYNRFSRTQIDGLTITAASGADPTITVESDEIPDNGRILDIGGSNVEFSGINIEGPGRGTGTGIHLGIKDGSNNITVSDVEIQNVLTGIQTSTTTEATIRDNNISGAVVGLSLQANNATISGNTIENLDDSDGFPAEGVGVLGTNHIFESNTYQTGDNVTDIRIYNDGVPAINNDDSGDEVSVANTILDSTGASSVQFVGESGVYDGSITIGETAYSTIQDAENASTSGDTITLEEGTYSQFTVDVSNITVTSAGDTNNTTVRLTDQRVNVRSSNVTVDGLSFIFEGQGIYDRGSDNLYTDNNFALADGTESNGYAIRLEGLTSGSEVRDNDFVGINTSADGEYGNGVVVSGPADHKIVENDFINNSIGVNVGSAQPAQTLKIANNEFVGQTDFAIAFNHDGSEDPTFNVTHNDIRSNSLGILVLSSGDINASQNNIVDNGQAISVNSATADVDATENWWGSASGPDEGAVVGEVTVDPWLDAPADEGGQSVVTATIDDRQFSSIQSAVNAAENGETVSIRSGQYTESVTIETPNVSVVGQGQDETVIDGRINIPVDEVSVESLTVRNGAPSGADEVEGIFIGNPDGFSDLDGDVTLRNVTVEDVHGHGTGNTIEGVHAKYYDADGAGDEIDGLQFDNLTIRNVTQTAAGADGVKLQAEVDEVSITNSTFSDIEGRWAYGVVSTPSSLEMGVPDDVTLRGNTIEEVSATKWSGVGLGIDGKDKNGYADASDIRATQNNFLDNDVDILNKEPDGGPMVAPLNYFGDDAPNVSGDVVYDPVLTTSTENVQADSPENIAEYGSVLELKSDGSRALAVGFSARPDESVGEMFGEMDITGNAFVYDNDAGEYRDIDGDYVPSVGEVVVLTSEGGIDETVTVPIETNVDNEAATPEAVSLNNGWNLVATGGTVGFDSSTLDIAGAEVQNDLQLQAQPSQPGLREEGEAALRAEHDDRHDGYTGAFEGTWIFVDDEPDSDAQLATGYAEDQSVEEYVFEVVYPNDPQAEYPRIPIRPGYPPAFGYPPEVIEEHPDLVGLEEDTDE